MDQARIMEILRDGVWQFIGAIFGLIAIGLTIWVFLKQRPKKLLVWQVLSIAPIFNIRSNIDQSLLDNIQITFEGRPIDEAYLVFIEIANRGNTPISRQDYDTDLSIVLSGGTLASTNIPGGQVNITKDAEKTYIMIKPFLLNAGKNRRIQAVVLLRRPSVAVNGEIIGGQLITQSEYENTLPQRILRIVAGNSFAHLAVVISIILIFTAFKSAVKLILDLLL